MEFKDKNVVVTGGSSGIGYYTAKRFLEEGAQVLITGRDQKRLESAQAELGDRAYICPSDVSKIEQLTELRSEIQEQFETIDVLFANAGVALPNEMGTTSENRFHEVFDTNVKGVFFTVETLLDIVKDGGNIILTSSIVGNKGMANLSLYNASKAAVRSFSRSWANDLKARGIRVNTVSPGVTETPIFKNSLGMDESEVQNLKTMLQSSSPIGRMAHPLEVSEAVLFLASQKASYVNGIELSVDGGFAQI